ncbi:hypothetical protein [Candidatus Electronema sp. PJ]|uniref:hypothetical protein n=1 Tax=Candidatus Electronema sp. PJ TaxID=3401572 RepID=UPI003AA8E722
MTINLPASRLTAVLACLIPWQLALAAGVPPDGEFTLNADFDKGTAINVVHSVPDQLQLDDTMKPFSFIWIAVSSKGTVVKINTETGEVLGEYKTAPDGMGLNPSRTTVDKNGNAWVTNRDEGQDVPAGAVGSGIPATDRPMGSVIHIGLKENGQCVDRNGNGVIDTSTGQNDVRGWSNAGGANTYGGISTAEDECILHYVRTNSTGARHVSVNKDNDVWISGTGGQYFDLIDGDTGMIIRQEPSVGYGGYGGLIDKNGVIWSANPLLRWDTALPLSGPAGIIPSGPSDQPGVNWTGYYHDSYGLCIDQEGNVWNTQLSGGLINKFAPNGALLGSYPHGSENAQGCVVDKNGNVWVAGSLSGNTVDHLLNDGTYVGSVTVGNGPTGVAVDAAGKIWATNYYSQTASRIDPNAGPVVNGVHVGEVDLTTVNLGGDLYNYSDMTGSTLIGAPDHGSWSVVHDAGIDNVNWNTVSWHSDEPGDSSIKVFIEGDKDCNTSFSGKKEVMNGESIASFTGNRCLQLTVEFTRSSTDQDGNGINDSPILRDILIDGILPENTPPVAVIAPISDAKIPLPVNMIVMPRSLNLARRGKWVKAHLSSKGLKERFSAEIGLLQKMEIVLDGSGSYDDDGDELSFDWTLTGPKGEIPVEDIPITKIILPAGNYTATLVVNDGTVDSEPAEEGFILTNYTASDLSSGSYQLNGVPHSNITAVGKGKFVISFNANAIAKTVQPGKKVKMVLTGVARGEDYIKVTKK